MRAPSDPSLPDRRELLLSAAAAALGIALAPGELWAKLGATTGEAGPSRRLLDELCDAVIPDTDTPGARAAGVSAFVELAAAHGLRGATTPMLAEFFAALDERSGGDYLGLSRERRDALLADLDARAFARPADSTLPAGLAHWPTLKALIVIGYYTSEIGAAQELRYLLVPGRFDPDVPLAPGDRAWSSDWTGVKFA